MWQNVSPALYKQIQNEDILTLPTAKYVRRLGSCLNVEAGYTVSELSAKDCIVAVLMDEVYVQKSIQYSNGKFYGTETNEVVTTCV